MKKEIHPSVHPVVYVDTSCGVEFITVSTLKSAEKRDIDGVSHYVLPVEISSASHPFYTGKQILIDTARRVEKFQEKLSKQSAASDARKGKKEKRAVRSSKKESKQAA